MRNEKFSKSDSVELRCCGPKEGLCGKWLKLCGLAACHERNMSSNVLNEEKMSLAGINEFDEANRFILPLSPPLHRAVAR